MFGQRRWSGDFPPGVTTNGSGWLTAQDVAADLGVSLSRVRAAARRGDLRGRRRNRVWLFREADVQAWSLAAPIEPRLRETRRYLAPDRRPHVELLEALVLSDLEIAEALKVAPEKVRRWRSHGVANAYVGKLRQLSTPSKARPSEARR